MASVARPSRLSSRCDEGPDACLAATGARAGSGLRRVNAFCQSQLKNARFEPANQRAGRRRAGRY